MEEENIKNENLPGTEGEKKEVHYHYHMDEAGGPQGQPPTQKREGEMHYHYYYEPPKMKKPKSAKPTVAGVLLLLHAIFNIAMVVLLISLGSFMADPAGGFMAFGGEDTADITGNVLYINGTGIENATISVVDTQFVTQTDEDGNYLIYNVPLGKQKFMVEKEGYNTIIKKVFVESDNVDMNLDTDQSDKFDFRLTQGDGTINEGTYPPVEFFRNFVLVCSVVLVILSIIALIGAYFSLKRENYKFALAGAIAGTISFGLFAFIALFILLLAKDEFKDPKKDTIQNGPLGGEAP